MNAVTNVTYVVFWILIGPLFAVVLFHLGEKRWGNGPTWAFLGFAFNIFAVLFFLLIAGYESNEATSFGAFEGQRVRAMVRNIKGSNMSRRLVGNPEVDVLSKITTDSKVDRLLHQDQMAEALAYARERHNVAFQTGDREREELYRGYIDEITRDDAERRLRITSLHVKA